MKSFKKILSLITVISIVITVLSASVTVCSAAGGSLGGSGTVRAGDTISVTLYASGPDVYGCNATFSYDSSVLTYKSYKQNISWGNFQFNPGSLTVSANDTSQSKPISGSSSIITLTFKVANNLPVGTQVSVKVSGKVSVLSSGAFKSTSFGGTYSKKVASPLSTNARLSALNVSNATITPSFSADVNEYSCSVPFEISKLEISAKAQDSASKISISNNALVAGGVTNVHINVTAPSGSVNTYTIKVKRAQDPNYVPDSNGLLSSLVIDGFSISPVFSPDIKEYVVWLPNEIENIEVHAEPSSNKATVTVSENRLQLVEGENLINISVKAENEEVTDYTVLAVRQPKYVSYEDYLLQNKDSQETVENIVEVESNPNEQTENPIQNIPMWGFVLICIFCLIAGFCGCLMIPRKKDESSDFEEIYFENNDK